MQMVQVLKLFYNAFLLGHAFCESSLKRVHNCCEAQNFWDIFSVLFEKLEELGKKQDIEDDELEALKVQLPTWWDYELQAEKEKDLDKKDEIYQKGLWSCFL
jgi:hypothetical protein